ncbi:hypothetical protein NFG57_03920 [Halomonas sp. H10-59]|uniref:Uncharacterized protein n=1 Tax=Halomonas sp. H10-59 TaxID=2950874 RepID=A0AAU7KW24_9GAMM
MALHTLFASSSSSLFLFDLLTFSRWGAVASLLATLGILALVIGCDRGRRLASLALLGYSLGQGLWLLDQVNRQVSLEALPAMSLLLMLLFAFCLWHGRGVGRRRYAALGIVCMVAGTLGFSILWTTEDAPRWRLILFESRPLGTVMVFTYGVIFWLFARQRSLNLRRLAPRVIKVGLIGTSLSMLVGFGGYHLYSLDLKQDLSTQLDTLSERIANWEERYRLGWSEWSLPLTQAGGSPEPTGPAARGEVLAYVWWQDKAHCAGTPLTVVGRRLDSKKCWRCTRFEVGSNSVRTRPCAGGFRAKARRCWRSTASVLRAPGWSYWSTRRCGLSI